MGIEYDEKEVRARARKLYARLSQRDGRLPVWEDCMEKAREEIRAEASRALRDRLDRYGVIGRKSSTDEGKAASRAAVSLPKIRGEHGDR